MNIDDKFRELYGFSPDDYYYNAIKRGYNVNDVLKDLNFKIDEIWYYQKKNDEFFPVGNTDIPDGFI